MMSFKEKSTLRTIVHVLLVASTFQIFSCELEENVYSSLTPESFFKNEADANTAVIGIYPALKDGYYSESGQMMTLLPSRYATGGNASRRVFSDFSYGAQNKHIENVWEGSYLAIIRANNVIDKVPEIEEMDEEKRNVFIAEAKFLRALVYFNLVRLYGNVPLNIDSNADNKNLPRSPIEDIYTTIISDLEFAEENLPIEPYNNRQGRATKGAAKALYGKVYLTMAGFPLQQKDKYQLAVDKFSEIIDKPEYGYKLLEDFAEIFKMGNEHNAEILFSINNAYIPGQGTVLTFGNWHNSAYAAGSGGNGWWGLLPNFFLEFGPAASGKPPETTVTDTRRDVTMGYTYLFNTGKRMYRKLAAPWRTDPRLGKSNKERQEFYLREAQAIGYTTLTSKDFHQTRVHCPIGKWKEPDALNSAPSNRDHASDIIVIRYADVLLMYAEALNGSGAPEQARQIVNRVRERAHAPIIDAPKNETEMKAIIEKERFLELTAEFTEWFDMIRMGTLKQHMEIDNYDCQDVIYDDKYLLYPIPTIEILANKSIGQADQNPGY